MSLNNSKKRFPFDHFLTEFIELVIISGKLAEWQSKALKYNFLGFRSDFLIHGPEDCNKGQLLQAARGPIV